MFNILLFLFLINLQATLLHIGETWQNRAVIDIPETDFQIDFSQHIEINKDFLKSELKKVLNDPDNLIADEFDIPKKIYDRVHFWASIYAVHSSTSVVFHDTEDLSLIYSVLDFSVLWADKKLNRGTKYWRMKKAVNEEKTRLQNILEKITASNFKISPRKLNREELKIYNLWKTILRTPEGKKRFASASKTLRHQTGQRNFIARGLQTSSKYMSYIEDVFNQKNLPKELTKLPFVESSFNLKATSKVGAKGLWQFMDATGKLFLEQDNYIDERYSPIKASTAAAKLLKSNYKILKTWPLAITAYNHGPGSLIRAVKKFKTTDITVIIEKHRGWGFGFASKNFYAEFLAALYVTTYSDRFFKDVEKCRAIKFEYVNMDFELGVKDISRITNLSVEEIASLNPDLSKKIITGDVKIRKGIQVKLSPLASLKINDYFTRKKDSLNLEVENDFANTNQ